MLFRSVDMNESSNDPNPNTYSLFQVEGALVANGASFELRTMSHRNYPQNSTRSISVVGNGIACMTNCTLHAGNRVRMGWGDSYYISMQDRVFGVNGQGSLVLAGCLVPCGMAVRHIKFPPFFVEVGHTLPSDIDETSTDKLVAVFSQAVAALGITSGAAKGDVFMTAKGPVIGEIAARLSGGYMSGWTFPLASGLELTRAALYLAMGLPLPSLAPPLDMVCAERAIISIPGRVAAMEGLKKALAPVAIKHCFTRVKVGDSVVFPRNNVEKAANIIAIGSNHHEASQAAESAIAGCLVRLAPGCVETEAFLFSPTVSQQPAYPGLLAAIPLPLDYRIACLQLAEQPALLAEQDWSWRSLAQSLDWLEQENLIRSVESFGSKRFWVALAWGGLQGAIYVMDTGIAEKTGVTLPS